MRIATSTAYDRGVSAILRENVDLNKTLLQIATGKRIITPADDPADSARILGLNQAKERTDKFQDNINVTNNNLEIEDTTLQGIVDLMQRVRELAIQGRNDTYDSQQRQSIGMEVQERFESLLGFANTRNGNGDYLFGGFNTTNPPFVRTVGGDIQYTGDQGQKFIQVGDYRQVASGDNGFDVFMDAPGAVDEAGNKISLFKIIDDLETSLRTNNGLPEALPIEGFQASMARHIDNIDVALGKIIDIQATIGARQNAVDNQKNVNADYLVQLETTMSETQDLDYATAISRMELQQLGLSAAQQSFTKIQGLSLFNFI